MKVTHSNLALSLIVSGLYLVGCSSSSSPAPTPSDDGASPPVTEGEPGTGGDVTPSTETPISETPNPVTPVDTIGGNVNTPLTGSISKLGMLNLSYEAIEDSTDISGQFFISGAVFSAAQLQAGLESDVVTATDICKITTSDSGTGFDFDDFDFQSLVPDLSLIPTTISAGEVITFTSPAGSFGTLVPSQMLSFLLYNTPDEVKVSGSIPSGLTADIPGAANGFPAIANVPVPQADPLALTIEGDANSGYSLMWNGSNANNSQLSISLVAIDLGGNDFSSLTYIECSLSDDGVQVLPANLLPTGNNVIISGGTASRTSFNLVQQGSAVLMVTSTSNSSISAIELN